LFQVLLFTDAEIAEIYRLLAAILHTGELLKYDECLCSN